MHAANVWWSQDKSFGLHQRTFRGADMNPELVSKNAFQALQTAISKAC